MDTDACGAGYVVRHNTIRNHRARGMLLKADGGLVEDNTIDGSSIAGIVLSPELYYWAEADYSTNVVIRRNTIRNTGYASSGPSQSQAGGLTVTGGGGIGHRNLSIEDNTFTGIRGVNLQIEDAQGVVIRNNRFDGTHSHPCRNGLEHGVDPSAVVWLGSSRQVRLVGNSVGHIGPYGKSALVMTSAAVAVEGATSGIRVADSAHKR